MTEQTPDSPRYDHDHEDCIFLGQWFMDDLYHCEQGGMPTLIARHGSSGGDYTSGICFEKSMPALAVAGDRARRLGLLS